MCGLFGSYLSKDLLDSKKINSKLRSAQLDLKHRGPDDTGLDTFSIPGGNDLAQGSLSLGHTRLSIIDLSSAGHQPMYSSDGRYAIIFNGEIYNYIELRNELKKMGYIFRTKSDTEVLLAVWERWGVSGLRRLNGMFAFVVYDHEDQSLTLARDAFGIKPLFYSLDQKSIYFASEIPALLKLLPSMPELDLQQVYDYLVYGHYDNQECTFYNNIKHLLPGHWLCINLNTMHVITHERWWWPSIKERTDLSFEDAAAQLRKMFLNNVRLHLRSDVPVGAALSGGIDSSAVVCAMRKIKPDMPIHTFTYVASGSTVNEEYWADIVNTYVGAITHKTEVKSKELGNDIDDLIRTQGEPFGSTSIYAQYCIFKEAHKIKIKVTLDGQGADELLAGYSGYPSDVVHSLFDKKQYFSAFKLLIRWANWPGRSYRDAFVMLMRLITPNFLISTAYKVMGRSPTPSWLNIKYLSEKGIRLKPPKRRKSSLDAHGRRLVDALRHSLTGHGLTSLLRHGDRNSMRWSIESRVPF